MKMHKDMTNNDLAELLRAVAASYELKDQQKNKFRIIAYERAADAVEHASSELKDLWDERKLDEVPGIGQSIAEHLDELFTRGKSKHFEEVMKGLPPQMFALMTVSGIGAKTAFKLVKTFKSEISEKNPIRDLEKIAQEGKIAKLEGFGEDSEKAILSSIKEIKGREVRLILPYASQIADEVLLWLRKSEVIKRADALGSLRRKASTVGDIDISASSEKPDVAIKHFIEYPHATRILENGERTAAVIVPGNRQVDLMVEKPESYGSLLQHFTGSKHHNISLREYALKKGFSVSDYGIYILDKNRNRKGLKKFDSEEKFYRFLGMDWIPPELRENTGEIDAALHNKLPKLVELSDIKADLQIHSDFDIETSHDLGQSSMREIVDKANKLNYQYIAFTEHNPSHSKHSKKQIIGILKRKNDTVEQFNRTYVKDVKGSVIKVFNSLEIDILPEGELPVPEEAFNYLDFALVSIHSSFRLSKAKMTKRVLKALDHPKIKIFAHPTARLLNNREGIDLDWPKIFEFCGAKSIWLEINSDPMRLDLPDFLIKEAIKAGIQLTLGTDSHHVDNMDNMKFGVSVARRGWAQKNNIINTLSFKEFEKMII